MKAKSLLFLLGLAAFGALAQSPSGAPSGLTPPVLYQYLLAEIAAQRGQGKLAAEAYLDLARRTQDARVARRATELALHANLRGPAWQAAELWLKLEPDSKRALQTLIVMHLAEGRLEAARSLLKRHLEAQAEQIGPAWMQVHVMLARASDKAAVLALLESLLADYAPLPEAHFALAQAAWNAGQTARAERALDEALRLKPGWEAAALFKGEILERQEGARAAEFWRGFLKRYPEAREVRLAYAKLLARLGRYAQAQTEFEDLLKGAPDNAELHLAAGFLALQGKGLDAAERHLKQALALGYPDVGQVRFYLGQLEEARRRYEAALEWYAGIEGEAANTLQAQLQSALVLGKLGRLDEARGRLARLKDEAPQARLQILQTEAQLLREAGEYAAVFELYTAALAEQPDSLELRYDRAMAAENLGRLDLLEADLRAILRVKPDHAHALNALGYTLADRTDRIAEALALVRQALSLAPDDPFILDSMGWALFKNGQVAEALDYLRRAYGQRRDPEIAAHLGEVLWALSHKDEARRIFSEALEANPDNNVLRETVRRLRP